VKKSENLRTEGLRELSGGFPFGLSRWNAALLVLKAQEFEALEVFFKRNCPKCLGFMGWKVLNCGTWTW
jgi:hypothetical protein